MRDLLPLERAEVCCENDFLNKSSGCTTHHTFEQLLELVSSYRDRVPEAAKVAGAFCVQILDIFTRSDVPDSARMLGEQQYREIIAGRRELLDAGIKLHATCLINSAYHGTERALQKAVAGEAYDAQAYMCSNQAPRERRRTSPELIASVFDREGVPSAATADFESPPIEVVGRGVGVGRLVELPPPEWDDEQS